MNERRNTHAQEVDARRNEAARLETLRRDGRRELGENLEQAAALIRAAFELRDSFSDARA
jgi:hypothetical protein